MATDAAAGPSTVRSRDPGWKYNFLPNPLDKNSVVCMFYQKETNGDEQESQEDDEVMEIPDQKNKRKNTNVKGPLDLYMTRKGKSVQKCINEACDKEIRGRTIQAIAAFFYQGPPTYHELRVPLLKNEVEKVDQWVEGHKVEWSKFGCSIMADGWTDRKQRSLINFRVNGSKGTVFMESNDASSYMKTGQKVFELLDNFVERIGEGNVVQIITDNGSNFKLAG
ncbi:hypothetical protein SSX86_020082 [Deinandra increscens subsp. villosa]|uniref:DUF659 domain-containing protein n=1 Tax=Deinandra increscens subsp. villosa TaxID=3103831 RepID=A0AAP0GWC4_9ASTR